MRALALVAALVAAAVLATRAQAHVPHLLHTKGPLVKRIRFVAGNLAHSNGVVIFCGRHPRWRRFHGMLCRWHAKAAIWQGRALARARAELRRVRVVRMALRFLGVPYVWGGTSPLGFDCSGLVQYIYRRLGVYLPRTTYEQFRAGRAVDLGRLKPGDVLFFYPSYAGPEHEGVYIGGGHFIAAPHTGANVSVYALANYVRPVGARRFV